MKSCTWMWSIAVCLFSVLSIPLPVAAQERPAVPQERRATPQVQYLTNKVNKLGPIAARTIVIKPLARTTVHAVEHEPASVALPKGPYRPWKSPGPETSVVGEITPKHTNSPHPPQGPINGGQSPFVIDQNGNVSSQLHQCWESPLGWETNVASDGVNVVYTSNYCNAFSADGGLTWTAIDPWSFMKDLPANPGQWAFCCDQVVQYAPKIDRFLWIVQQNVLNSTNENRYRVAYVSPAELKSSNGQTWHSYDVLSHDINPGGWFDYPEIAVGNSYLYLTCNLVGGAHNGRAVMVRLPLSSFVSSHGTVVPDFNLTQNWNLRPVQNVGDEGIFVDEQSDSQLMVYGWAGTTLRQRPVDVATFATADFSSRTPSGSDWLNGSKITWKIHGATKTGNEIWVAWNAARGGKFLQPHIEGAVIDESDFALIRQFAIYSKSYAEVYPVLATDSHDDVGISYSYGGGTIYPHFGVGFLTPAWPPVIYRVDPDGQPNVGAGGHYQGIRPTGIPGCFVASGNVWALNATHQDGYFVRFGHAGPDTVHCEDPCQTVEDQIQSIQTEIAGLQDQLNDPGTPAGDKKFIARRIHELNNELTSAGGQLQACEQQHP